MTKRPSPPQQLWGHQHPFERNYLQRSMTVAALAMLGAVSLILIVQNALHVLAGIALICAGAGAGLAALSRQRYLRETEVGFVILQTRDGRFVLASAAAFVAVDVLAVLVILLG